MFTFSCPEEDLMRENLLHETFAAFAHKAFQKVKGTWGQHPCLRRNTNFRCFLFWRNRRKFPNIKRTVYTLIKILWIPIKIQRSFSTVPLKKLYKVSEKYNWYLHAHFLLYIFESEGLKVHWHYSQCIWSMRGLLSSILSDRWWPVSLFCLYFYNTSSGIHLWKTHLPHYFYPFISQNYLISSYNIDTFIRSRSGCASWYYQVKISNSPICATQPRIPFEYSASHW